MNQSGFKINVRSTGRPFGMLKRLPDTLALWSAAMIRRFFVSDGLSIQI
jgi:hypothetical protein